MLLQMHIPMPDGSTRMMEQKEFNHHLPDSSFEEEVGKWIKEVKAKYPLPEKTIWLMKVVEPCDSCLGSGEIVYGSDTEAGREVVKCDCAAGKKTKG